MLDDALSVLALEHLDEVLARNLETYAATLAVVDDWLAGEPRLHHVRREPAPRP